MSPHRQPLDEKFETLCRRVEQLEERTEKLEKTMSTIMDIQHKLLESVGAGNKSIIKLLELGELHENLLNSLQKELSLQRALKEEIVEH